ncbi:MAG: MFS transporter [Alphaproteobacteria bacterium]
MLRSYLTLLRDEPRVLLFGAACAFLSSPGQTFFISQFNVAVGRDLGLQASELGATYLVGTLGAAVLLPFVGHWIDRIDLARYTALVMAALGVACAVKASATGVIGLALAWLLLRLCGQGLMTHIAVTSIARYFEATRGRALSLVALGFALAQGVLPALAVMLIAVAGWRAGYAITGAVVALVAAPVLVWLIRRQTAFRRAPASVAGERPRAWSGMLIVARTRFFWLALPILLYMPFTSTALVFHIQAIAAIKSWTPEQVAAGFAGYAVAHAVSLPLAGILVDRFGSRVLMSTMNLPLLAGIGALGGFDDVAALIALLALMGLSSGIVQTAGSAVWAEVYGIAQLGTIRSFAVMLMVAGTALGPATVGLMLDSGLAISAIAIILIGLGLVGSALVATVAR